MMLQNLSLSTNPPHFAAVSDMTQSPAPMATTPEEREVDAIQASIAPLGIETDLLNTLREMADKGETRGMIALFDTFVAIADAMQGFENQPRCKGEAAGYLEDECCRTWAKAYMVADFLKDQPVAELHDEVGRVLLSCAIAMGLGIKKAAAIAEEIASLP